MTAAHLAFVRSQPCCVPGCRTGAPVQAHHVRTAANAGTGMKPPDATAAPLCAIHHAEHDRIGKRSFAARYGIDLAAEAALLAAGVEMP